MKRRLTVTMLLAALLGCSRASEGPVRAVVIGGEPRIVDATIVGPIRIEDAVLLRAAAEGIVNLDSDGEVVSGLATRWNVSDDGLSYIFRLGKRRWSDGSRVTARFVVRRLRAAAAEGSRNPLATVLSGIDEIVATTDEVFEIRLRAPRPNLLQHLAQPELAIVQGRSGAGPFTPSRGRDGSFTLTRMVQDGEEERAERVTLRAMRSALAVAAFDAGRADLVLGGTLGDLPIVRAADLPERALRFDPASGFLGLAVVEKTGSIARAELRRALSMAIDREAIVASIAVPGLQPRSSLAPLGLSNLSAPSIPAWLAAPIAARRAEARRLAGGGVERPIRVAMPDAPGYRLLFAHLKRDWAAIGIPAERVELPRDADLRLLDAVAPSRGASWYYERFACARSPICDEAADRALEASRSATDAATRAAYFAQADRRLAETVVFIPITAPVRWTLAAPRITNLRPNPYAVHSLVDLVEPSRRR